MRGIGWIAGGLVVFAAVHASAQDTGCDGFKWPVSREQAAFAAASLPVVASGSPLPGPGQAAVLNLTKQDAVAFPVAPSRKPKHEMPNAGLFPLSVATAGTYQITLSDDAWIEVEQGGRLLHQVGFTGSHSCSTVHKSVRFDLAAGPATVEISDAGAATVKIEVVAKD